MNFELLLFIFICILLGVLAFDYRKKRTVLSNLNKQDISENIDKDKLENPSKFGKGEYVSKPRVVRKNSEPIRNQIYSNTKKNPERKDIIVSLFIEAKDDSVFIGNDLLRVLLSLGCRYGDMKIFHRHEHKNGIGKEIFSIASMLEPGIFDLTNLPEAKIPGIVMFFSTRKVDNPLEVYQLMLDSAKKISHYLNGELLDSSRSILTSEKIENTNELLANFINEKIEEVL